MEYRPQPLLNQVLDDEVRRIAENCPPSLARKHQEKGLDPLPLRLDVGIKDYPRAGNRQMRTVLLELKMPFDSEDVDGVDHDPSRLCQKVGLKGCQFHARTIQAAAERPVD